MNLLDFVGTVVAVTASGALAPGPLTFGTIMQGTKKGARSGFSSAIGHTIVEFPLVLALAMGLLAAASQPLIKLMIGLVGGASLIGFGTLQIYDTLRTKEQKSQASIEGEIPRSSVLLGFALTGLNPYFILWWLGAGSKLIMEALGFATILGVLLMYASHVWMDYAFLTAIAHFAKKGRDILNSKYYKLLLVAFGLVLIYFGADFILGAVKS